MKYCPYCGTKVDDSVQFCANCGNPIQKKAEDINGIEMQNNTVRHVVESSTKPIKKKKTSGLGIVAFILSFTIIASPIAVILAILDLAINHNKKHGLTIAALVIGGLISTLLLTRILGGSNTESSSSASTEGTVISTATSKPTEKPMTDKEKKEAYIRSCTTINYEDVERTPDAFYGKNVRIEGTVIQVSEGLFDSVVYRVATGDKGHDNVWLVRYTRNSDEERILEDDRIIIYGACDGVESYKTVLGNTITIPSLKAKYIDRIGVSNSVSEAKFTTNIVLFDICKKKYSNDYEYRGIVEIKNTGNSSIYIKDAAFDLEDSTGHLLQTDDFSVSIYRTIIKPGEIGYIYTSSAIDIKDSSTIDELYLKPQVSVVTTYVTLTEYEITDTSISQGKYGVSVTGRVTNNTSNDDSYTYIRVAFFDDEGNIIGISGTSVTGLDAGKTISFEVSGISLNNAFSIDDVANYQVLAEETYYGF